jgi:branched-chain amino acid transport system ATP-binding protein
VTGLLELRDVGKRFGGVAAVDGVDLTVEEGAVFGLIGPNGAGKTTVVNLITGYFRPTTGTITVGGTNVLGMRPHRLARLGVARTYQNLQLFDESTVLENVLIGRHLAFKGQRWQMITVRRREEREQHAVARALIDRVGLSDVADVDVADLPYGLRRLSSWAASTMRCQAHNSSPNRWRILLMLARASSSPSVSRRSAGTA